MANKKSLNLHLRILEPPQFSYPDGPREMLARVNRLLDAYQIDIEAKVLSERTLFLTEYREINASTCVYGQPTAQQAALLSIREDATSEKDVFIYFVQSIRPLMYGCAAHLPGMPGVVIASAAPGWTLAHEIGHVLGLSHILDNKRHLMFPNVSQIILDPVTRLPQLTDKEKNIMERSSLLLDH